MSKTIILAAHGHDEPTLDALALAVALARARDCELLLTGIWASPLGAGDALYARLVREPLSRELRRLRDEVPDDVRCRIHVAGSTSVARGLHRVAEREGAELLVVGPTHLGDVAHAVRGDIAVSLLHDAPCPVAVAPPGHRAVVPGTLPELIVGWHGAPEDDDALETAVAIAQGSGATVHVVTVIELPSPTPWIRPSTPSPSGTGCTWKPNAPGRSWTALGSSSGSRRARDPHPRRRSGRPARQCVHGRWSADRRLAWPRRAAARGARRDTTGLVRAAQKPVLVVPHGALSVTPTVSV